MLAVYLFTRLGHQEEENYKWIGRLGALKHPVLSKYCIFILYWWMHLA